MSALGTCVQTIGRPQIIPNPQSESVFVKSLTRKFGYVLYEEMELTVYVAVFLSMGYSRAEIVRRLDSSDLEIKMAMERLRRIAEEWK